MLKLLHQLSKMKGTCYTDGKHKLGQFYFRLDGCVVGYAEKLKFTPISYDTLIQLISWGGGVRGIFALS